MTFCRACLTRDCPPGSRILPHMDVWLCPSCVTTANWVVYSEQEITNKRFAPWTTAQTDSLRAYQRALEYLPFVCERNHVLQVTEARMHCPLCDFELLWAYPWTLDWTWHDERGYGGHGGEPNAPVPRRPPAPLREHGAQIAEPGTDD